MRRENTSGSNGQLLKSTKISETKELGDGGVGLYLIVGLALCLFEIAIFEADASLKWMPL